MQVFVWTKSFISFGEIPRNEISGYMANVCLTVSETAKSFFRVR